MVELSCTLAEEKDIAFISEIYHENISSLHGVPRNEDTWKELLADPDSVYYVVRGAEPVAWFRIDITDGEFWIGMLQVKPAYHRRGVGTYILSVAEDLAKAKKMQRIGIHATQDNAAAGALYWSAGYSVTEIGPCTTADGIERVGYTFEKQLDY